MLEADHKKQPEHMRFDKVFSAFLFNYHSLWFQHFFIDVNKLVLIVLGESGELVAQCGGVVVLTLIRVSAYFVDHFSVDPGPKIFLVNTFEIANLQEKITSSSF